MDEATGSIPTIFPEDSPEHTQHLAELESARQELFDDGLPNDIKEWLDKTPQSSFETMAKHAVQALIDPKTGNLFPRARAMRAFNNLTRYLPGGGGFREERPSPDWGNRSPADFWRDFEEFAPKANVDINEVEARSRAINEEGVGSSDHSTELLELFRYVFPVIENLVKEKDYPGYY